jgi:hypothetical protein
MRGCRVDRPPVLCPALASDVSPQLPSDTVGLTAVAAASFRDWIGRQLYVGSIVRRDGRTALPSGVHHGRRHQRRGSLLRSPRARSDGRGGAMADQNLSVRRAEPTSSLRLERATCAYTVTHATSSVANDIHGPEPTRKG